MVYLIIGLATLWVASELFVESSSKLATEFRVPKYIIGILITSLGTSLPEFVLSLYGALTDHVDMVIGNIVGSNIANIAVGLGILSVVAKKGFIDEFVEQHVDYIKTDQNFLLVSTGFILVGSYMAMFGRPISILALLVIIYFIKIQIFDTKHSNDKSESNKVDYKIILLNIGLVVIAAILIYFGSRWTITGGVALAQLFGVPELVIGLITIAFGTSLPEIAVVIAACRKAEIGLALGNIIGSNIYNVCLILGLIGILKPLAIDIGIFDISNIYLTILTIFIVFFLKYLANRIAGGLLLLSYIVFVAWNFA